jgi:hypothetical protein
LELKEGVVCRAPDGNLYLAVWGAEVGAWVLVPHTEADWSPDPSGRKACRVAALLGTLLVANDGDVLRLIPRAGAGRFTGWTIADLWPTEGYG